MYRITGRTQASRQKEIQPYVSEEPITFKVKAI
jgi:hypothetical protein